MDYRELREVMKYLHCKGMMPKDIYADMVNTLGDSAPSYAMVKKWVTEFRKGRVSTEDLVRSGRPRDVSTYENVDCIRHLIRDDERVTVQDIAKSVGISFGSVHAILSKLLEMVKVSGRWVPRRVVKERKITRLEFCKEILAWYRVNPNRLVQQTVIDDAWIYHFERSDILFPNSSESMDGEKPRVEPTGILSRALTGQANYSNSNTTNNSNSTVVEGALDKECPSVSSTTEVSDIKTEENAVDSSVQDVKIGSTKTPKETQANDAEAKSISEIKLEDIPQTDVVSIEPVTSSSAPVIEDSAKAENDGVSTNNTNDKEIKVDSSESNVVDSTVDSEKKDSPTKVTNGTAPSSAVPNILAILGQRPVNGLPSATIQPSFIPLLGPNGLTLGQLSGSQFSNLALLSGANVTQLANLSGVTIKPLISSNNLAQLTKPGTLVISPDGKNVAPDNSVGHTNQKRPSNESCPQPTKKLRGGRTGSDTSCIFWDSYGVIHIERLDPGKKLTGDVYCDMLKRLKEAMESKRPGSLEEGVLLIEDQAPSGAKPPRGIQLLPLPVHSPDLSPSDFFIFHKVKEHVRSQSSSGLISQIESFLMTLDESQMRLGLSEMERRCTLCADLNGDYVEK